MASYNRFGAAYTDVVAMFPGTAAADFGGQTAIEAVMSRVAREVAGALVPKAYHCLAEQVELELIEDYATAAQTSFTLGLLPVVSGSVHLWRFSRDAILRTKPRVGWCELTITATNTTTGVVTVSDTISTGDKVFATYEIDPESSSFSWPSVADAVLLGSAAELGARLYTAADQQEWALVTEYRGRYNGRMGIGGEDGVLRLARSGQWLPDELRTLRWWTELDVAGSSMGTVDLLRG